MDSATTPPNEDDRFLGLKLNGPTIWLAYFLWFIATWTFQPPHKTEFIAALISFAIFLPLYYDTYYKKGRRTWYAIAIITVISIMLATLTASASIFFIYAVQIATRSLNGRARAAWLIGIFIAVIIPAITGHVSWYFTSGCCLFGPMVAIATATNSRLQEQSEELVKNQAEIRSLATSAERERIARDMHDTLGHVLTLITAKSDFALRVADTDAKLVKQELMDINLSARQALKSVRDVITGIENTSIANELGHARYLLETANVHIAIENSSPVLPDNIQHALGMIIREATTNIVKHANASRCVISLVHSDTMLTLKVKDNGQGKAFIAKTGLTSIESRARALNGQFSLKSSEETGTQLLVKLPLKHEYQA